MQSDFFTNLPFVIRSGQIHSSGVRIAPRIMTSDPPPSSSDGKPLPPRHRPSLENLNKDTSERDLWAFEEDLELGTPPPPEPVVEKPPRSHGQGIPLPRERRTTQGREAGPSKEGGEPVQMNINKPRLHPLSGIPTVPRTESEFDDLEQWTDVPKEPQPEERPYQPVEPLPELPVETLLESAEPSPAPVSVPAAAEPDDDEFSPRQREDAKRLELKPSLGLNHVERTGLVVLLLVLVLGGLAIVAFSLKHLTTQSATERINQFPIKGSKIEVASASSYWREPITDGASPETFRRGTKLLPVLELEVSGGNGAIRVLFRNDERTVVGDAVTRAVRGAGVVVVPATAGFEDLGMHAAYRTGGSKPWSIEVFEAASESSPGENVKRLFEMNISTDRR
jgi:hypothetical protein